MPPNRQRIRARTRRAHTTPGDPDTAKRAICALLFEDPACIVDSLSHAVTGPVAIREHTHADLLQLDLIVNCTGEITVGEQRVAAEGLTLMVAPPHVPHGYTLRPGPPPSEAWLIKVRVPGGWHWGRLPLPPVLTGLTQADELQAAIAGFAAHWTRNGVSVDALSHLARAVCLWPTSAAAPPTRSTPLFHTMGGSAAARVRRSAETLAQRTHDPPSLEELAAAAHLSPRHFARCFQELYGCTPHDYVTSRRLDAARALLLRPGLAVGDAAHQLGFGSAQAFTRWFTRQTGRGPRAFREDPTSF